MVKKIFIAAPIGYTGGITALFQLCHAINSMGGEAIIAFYSIGNIDIVRRNYKKYLCSWTLIGKVQDGDGNIILVPEVATSILSRFRKMSKIIYWLSVDNYIISNYLVNRISLARYIEILRFLLKNYWFDIIGGVFLPKRSIRRYYGNAFRAFQVYKLIKERKVDIPKADLHIVQSDYVRVFLKEMGVSDDDMIFVHEPIEDEYLELAVKIDISKKKDIIAWNARKAYPIAYKLVRKLKKRYTVYELLNVGKRNMIKILALSKVFIDIGIHPGRDRPVREAIALASIPIVNIHGGYNLFEDLPIPNEFKIPIYLDYTNYIKLNNFLKEIYNKILYIMENYEYYVEKLNDARKWVLSEKDLFLNDVRNLLKKMEQL